MEVEISRGVKRGGVCVVFGMEVQNGSHHRAEWAQLWKRPHNNSSVAKEAALQEPRQVEEGGLWDKLLSHVYHESWILGAYAFKREMCDKQERKYMDDSVVLTKQNLTHLYTGRYGRQHICVC